MFGMLGMLVISMLLCNRFFIASRIIFFLNAVRKCTNNNDNKELVQTSGEIMSSQSQCNSQRTDRVLFLTYQKAHQFPRTLCLSMSHFHPVCVYQFSVGPWSTCSFLYVVFLGRHVPFTNCLLPRGEGGQLSQP